MHLCLEPTVVAARQDHHRLPAAAMRTCKLKKTTAGALIAMYSLDTQGRRMNPGSVDEGACEDLINGLIIKIKETQPRNHAALW